LVDEFYAPEQERGVRWDDPKFGLGWPAQPTAMSDKDRAYPDFEPTYHLGLGAGASR
jgi:dTDP-4-dehydrorhamnose 3,5-epimerase